MTSIKSIDQKEIIGIIDYLSYKIQRSKSKSLYTPHVIVTLAKGGLIPARLLAKSLNINIILSYGISFYDDNNIKTNSPVVYQDLISSKEILQNKDILIVDDIIDSGDSIHHCIEHLTKDLNINRKNIRVCGIFKKDYSWLTPDYYFGIVDYKTWIHFPWE